MIDLVVLSSIQECVCITLPLPLLLPVLWTIHLISPDLAGTDVSFPSFLPSFQ